MKKNAPPSLRRGTNTLETGTNALRAPVTAVRAGDLAELTKKMREKIRAAKKTPAKKAKAKKSRTR